MIKPAAKCYRIFVVNHLNCILILVRGVARRDENVITFLLSPLSSLIPRAHPIGSDNVAHKSDKSPPEIPRANNSFCVRHTHTHTNKQTTTTSIAAAAVEKRAPSNLLFISVRANFHSNFWALFKYYLRAML